MSNRKTSARSVIDKRIIEVDTGIYNSMYDTFKNGSYTINTPYTVLDPYSAAPLSMQAGVKSEVPTRLSVTVCGKNSPDGDISKDFFDGNYHTEHFFPIYGLYAGYDNTIKLRIEDKKGNAQEKMITVTTLPLPDDYAQTDIIKPAQKDKLNDELYYMCVLPSYLSALDKNADVRWLINEIYADLPHNLNGDSTLFLLNNGRLLGKYLTKFGLIEFDQTGRIYKVTDLDFFQQHDLLQMPDNNILIQAEDESSIFNDDLLAVMDYETGEFIKWIDFKTILDINRIIQPNTPPDIPGDIDWLHENSIDYDAKSNVYITSSRHQDVVFAIDQDTNELRWMLGAHNHWSEKYQPYLLTPVDEKGKPLYDFSNPEDVRTADHEFWNWAQHSARIFMADPNANTIDLFLFDDGAYRSYNPTDWIVPYENWSRAVLYRINHKKMTVQLLWQFGKDLGQDYYSGYCGNVQYIKETNSLYISSGGTNKDLDTGRNVGIPGDVPMDDFPPADYFTANIQEVVKIIEVSLDTNEILFAFNQHGRNSPGIFHDPQYKGLKAGLYTSV